MINVEVITCPRCGGRAWYYVDEDRAECTTCGMVWWSPFGTKGV